MDSPRKLCGELFRCQATPKHSAVIPAAFNSEAGQAGIHFDLASKTWPCQPKSRWIPAFAGMTSFIVRRQRLQFRRSVVP